MTLAEYEDDKPMVDEGIIRCICTYDHDDGFTIQCEECLCWQHADCVLANPRVVPDKYFCEECRPRAIDVKRAQERQRKKGWPKKKRGKAKKSGADKEEDDEGWRVEFSETAKCILAAGAEEVLRGIREASAREEIDGTRRPPIPLGAAGPGETSRFYMAQLPGPVPFEIRATERYPARYGYFLAERAGAHKLLTPVYGEVEPLRAYQHNAINQYAQLRGPKPHVHFVGRVAVDSRRWGNAARFVRVSCAPNARVVEITTAEGVEYAVMSLRRIAAGEEVCVPWGHPAPPESCACDASACRFRQSRRQAEAGETEQSRPQAEQSRPQTEQNRPQAEQSRPQAEAGEAEAGEGEAGEGESPGSGLLEAGETAAEGLAARLDSPGLDSPGLYSPGLHSPGLHSPGLHSPAVLNSPGPGLPGPGLPAGPGLPTKHGLPALPRQRRQQRVRQRDVDAGFEGLLRWRVWRSWACSAALHDAAALHPSEPAAEPPLLGALDTAPPPPAATPGRKGLSWSEYRKRKADAELHPVLAAAVAPYR